MLQELFQSWQNLVFHPSVASFERERPGASYRKIWINLVIAAVLSAAFAAIGLTVIGLFEAALGGPEQAADILRYSVLIAVLFAVFIFLSILLGFWVGQGVYFPFARLYGGRGSYLEQSYLLALSTVPLGIVLSAIDIIPCVGASIAMVGMVYLFILTTLALRSAHGLTTGRAVLTWLTPMLIGFACECLCILLVVARLAIPANRGFSG